MFGVTPTVPIPHSSSPGGSEQNGVMSQGQIVSRLEQSPLQTSHSLPTVINPDKYPLQHARKPLIERRSSFPNGHYTFYYKPKDPEDDKRKLT